MMWEKRVPVGEVLGVLRALHDAMPKLHIAAFADGRAAHGEQGRGGDSDDDEDCGKRTNRMVISSWDPGTCRAAIRDAIIDTNRA